MIDCDQLLGPQRRSHGSHKSESTSTRISQDNDRFTAPVAIQRSEDRIEEQMSPSFNLSLNRIEYANATAKATVIMIAFYSLYGSLIRDTVKRGRHLPQYETELGSARPSLAGFLHVCSEVF